MRAMLRMGTTPELDMSTGAAIKHQDNYKHIKSYEGMFEPQSQAPSTRPAPLETGFKKTLRLNRDRVLVFAQR